MKFSKNSIVFVGLLIVALLLLYTMRGENDVVHLVTLEATTDSQSYKSGDPVMLIIDIVNSGETATCISDTTQGNIKFASITRNGQPVLSRTVTADFLEALSEFVKADLQTVKPGEQVNISLLSSYDPGIDAQALHTSEIDGISAETTFYSIKEPGNYEVQVVYEYSGVASDDCQAIFKDQTNTATLNFTIE